MKNYLLFWKLIVISVIMVGITSCDPDDENECCDPSNPKCPNYDACYGVVQQNANFKIEQYSGSFAPDSIKYMKGDEVFHFGILRFTALDNFATSYKWYLGTEVISNQQFSRSFQLTDLPVNTEVDVSLVTSYNPDTICFPGDVGRDSISKSFILVELCDLKVNNKFKGVFQNAPEDTTDIQISFYDSTLSECGYEMNTYNLGGADLYNRPNHFAITDTAIVFYNGSGSATPNGTIKIDPTTNKMHMSIDYYSTHFIFDGVIVP